MQLDLNLRAGQKLRDEGIAQTASKNSAWMESAWMALERYCLANEYLTLESFRVEWQKLGRAEPTHPNAWGALGKKLNDSGVVEYLKHIPSNHIKARGRQTPFYRSRVFTKAA